MQIIIPMAWKGNRFKEKWYTKSKYLLEIQWETIIEKIIWNFDKKNDSYVFICNKEDYKKNDLEKLFNSLDITYKLIAIEGHKLWPVYTVVDVEDQIDLDMPTVVNYCDFFWEWDYTNFKKDVIGYDWAIICYKWFHPHLLHPNLYAWVRVNDKNEMIEIKEKYSFTPNKMDTLQSSWTYYFKSWKILIDYSKQLIKDEIKCNNEYYTSLLYNPLKDDWLKIIISEVDYFFQLGTAEDYEEYKYFESIFMKK